MPDRSEEVRPSLRERKKQNTRRLLVNSAIELCLKQGYENTTVEQISAAAEISTRTFSRYFATKDAVFIAVLDDLSDEVADELTRLPDHLSPMEALRAAHVAVLLRVAKRPFDGLTAERVALMLRVVNSSEVLQQAAIDYRNPAAVAVLAQKMRVEPDDRELDLGVALFTTTVVSACRDLVDDGRGGSLSVEIVLERLQQALSQVAQFAADLDVSAAR